MKVADGNSKIGIHIVFKCLQKDFTGNPNVFAGINATGWFTFEFEHAQNHWPYFNIGSTIYCKPTSSGTFVLSDETLYDVNLAVDFSAHTWNVSGTWNTSGAWSGSISCNDSSTLLVGRRSSENEACAMEVHLVEITKDNILVRQFIPTVDSARKHCFFDKVSKTYFYSAGEGAFESEEDVS